MNTSDILLIFLMLTLTCCGEVKKNIERETATLNELSPEENVVYTSDLTPLMHATKNGDVDIVKSFLKKGANPNEINLDGESPIALSITYEHIDVLKILLKAGADPNLVTTKTNFPVIRKTIVFGRLEYLKLLLEFGADVNVTMGGYGTPLARAIRIKQTGLALFLIDKGADPFLVTKHSKSAFNYLCENESWHRPMIIAEKLTLLEAIKAKYPELTGSYESCLPEF